MVGALLTSACIPSPTEYPHQPAVSDVSPDVSDHLDVAPDAPADASTDVAEDAAVTVDAPLADATHDIADATESDACVAPTDAEVCAAAGAACGRVEVTDVCGAAREVQCGGCAGGQTCTLDNECCTPQTNTDFCDMYAADCGLLDGRDNCGVQRTEIPCGTCNGSVECLGTRCGTCEPERDADFCARYGRDCSEFTAVDNCGASRTVNCGSCTNGANCIAAGVCVCPGGTSELDCTDGIDNDCDGLVDCLDPDCAGQRCGTGLDLRTCQAQQCRLL